MKNEVDLFNYITRNTYNYTDSDYWWIKEALLDRDFVLGFNNIDWGILSKYFVLSEPFIREFKDKVDWFLISQYQTLSEPFIREFEDKVYWSWISHCQILSEPFICEFEDKVDWFWILNSQNITEKFKDEVVLKKLEEQLLLIDY